MPHIIVEHSKNITKTLYIQKLIGALHGEAMTISALPTGGIRTRAHQVERYRVGDGNVGNGFVYIVVRLGQGRTDEVKREIGDRLFAILTEFTKDHFDAGNPLSLGLEIQEIEKDWTWKKNNIHELMKG
ncbi:MAG: 5-carboxymethyl-2-hydroxymuconate isomerase [Maricaulaceae bacterium]